MKAQLQMSWRSPEDLLPIATLPLFTLIFMAVLDYAGRNDLAGYALVAPTLLTITGMGIWTASELLAREKGNQTLELVVAVPVPFALVLFPRIPVLTSLGLIGCAEAWLLQRFVFGEEVVVHHPWLVLATLSLAIFASAGTALITAALVCFARSTRTLQNSISFPLYLLSGVLVPVSYFPDWLEPVSRLLFLYWAAELLRDAMAAGPVEAVPGRLAAILVLGAGAFALGAGLIQVMLNNLRREGSLGLS
jgi:ABC-2 type transport system permease protein